MTESAPPAPHPTPRTQRPAPNAPHPSPIAQHLNAHGITLFLELMAVPCMMTPPNMKTKTISTSVAPVTRRTFLRNGAVLTAGLASLSLPARAQANKNSKLRVFQIG